jgi:iron complex outermembrane receptor protein
VIGLYNGVNGGGELVNVIDVAPGETRQSIAADGSDNGRDLADLGFLVDAGPRPVPGGDFFGYIDPDGDDFKTSGDYAFEGNGHTENKDLNGRVDWEISEGMTLTSITDWKEYEKLMFLDVDAAPVNQLANYAGVDANSFTQELRLNGTSDRMRWVAGLYYLNIDIDSLNGLKAPENTILAGPVLDEIFGLPPAVDIGVDAQLETDSYSVFGQIEYDLSEQLTLITGLRAMREDKDYHMTNGFYVSTSSREVHQGGYLGGPVADYSDTSSDDLWTGKIQLDWRPSDDLLLYAGVNRGVKAGSYNAPLVGGYFAAGGNSALPYDEEVLLSYEGGFKASMMDGLARLNGAVFYYDYTDYQAFLFTGVGGVVINRDAENIGAEMDLQLSPADGWDIMLGASWYDAEVKDVPLVIGSSTSINVKPTYAPELQAFGLVRYEWSALTGTMAIQTDFSYSDEFYYNLRNFDADKFDSYTLYNARLSWLSANHDWEIALAARNLTDERAGMLGYDLSNLCGCNEVSYRDPRWYGVNVRYTF